MPPGDTVRDARTRRQLPTGTYRLQLDRDFPFAAAAAQTPYLARLGVSHLYLSPVLTGVPGSKHGYDVLDHTHVSPELGGTDGLRALADAAHQQGLGIVVDVVPNHISFVAPEYDNPALWDVLREGRSAARAHWFDVDWDHLDGRIGLPLLGDTLEATLAAGELTLDRYAGEPVVRYHEHVFPLAAGTANGEPADVLARQHYLLASWRDSDLVLNYRRFFAVDRLIALRVELPDVFEETHRVLLDLNAAGVVDGFRIDHPDGLADPEGYLDRLRTATVPRTPVWVEKILEGGERLPATWPTSGTTGYEVIRELQTALVDPSTARVLDGAWQATGGCPTFAEAALAAKRHVVANLFQPEVSRLHRRAVEALGDIDDDSEGDAEAGTHSARLREALEELLVAGDVYRAYLRPGEPVAPEARRRLEEARSRAAAARPDLAHHVDRLVTLALGQGEVADPRAAADFAVRVQQTWGPVMAKGIEDTAFYRWNRHLSLNEVGGEPSVLAEASPHALHEWARRVQHDWPHTLTTLSTHDTKRSVDVRSRLLAVGGDARSWQRCSDVFRAAAAQFGVDAPTAHLLWQTLVGTWPIARDRLHAYLVKAVREASLHTTYTHTDEGYEGRVLALADRATAPGPLLGAVQAALARNLNGIRATTLTAKLLQLTLSGVPDTYQGCELVDLSLVDPDNRRPVAFEERSRRLSRLESGTAPEDLDDESLQVVTTALHVRRDDPEAFGARSAYQPLISDSEHALGFVRGGRVVAVGTRAPYRLEAGGGWKDSSVVLPPGRWRDALTGREVAGGEVPLACLLGRLPVALLRKV